MKAKKINCKGKCPDTTNYPKDNHAAFCERCYSHNHGCPKTETKRKFKFCNL